MSPFVGGVTEDRELLKKIKVDLEHLVKATELIANPSRVDRMSTLPWELLDNILGRLPVNVVAKMSVLSRRWKNNWKYISSVIFSGRRYPRVVYHVLLSHHGNIEKFSLSSLSEYFKKEDLICWLNFLRRNGNGIKEISIEFNVMITSLSGIDGFSKLATLTLSNFTIDAEGLEILIAGCPLLENLKLVSFRIWECLHIRAHMLRSLHIDGNFKDLCIESNSRLTDVHFNLKFSSGIHEATEQGVAAHLVESLGQLSQIKKLSLCGFVYKVWVTKCKLEGKTIAGDNVSVLRLLDVWTHDVGQISAVGELLKNFTNLREFFINLAPNPNCCSFGSTRLPGVHPCDSNLSFNQLKFVKIETSFDDAHVTRNMGRFFGRALIVAILKSSPALKEMIVKGFSCDVGFMRELLSTPRASQDMLFKYFCNHCSVNLRRNCPS